MLTQMLAGDSVNRTKAVGWTSAQFYRDHGDNIIKYIQYLKLREKKGIVVAPVIDRLDKGKPGMCRPPVYLLQ